jgi:hypothetical protein
MSKFAVLGIEVWEGTLAEFEATMYGWTTVDVADLLGCTRRRVQKLRDGTGGSLSRADRIAMALAANLWSAQISTSHRDGLQHTSELDSAP